METKEQRIRVDRVNEETPIELKPSKVTIKQIRKSGLPVEAGHDGEYRFSRAEEWLTVQFKRGTKELVTGLTSADEAYFANKLALPGKSDKLPQGTLSRYNMDFWAKFKIKIPAGGKTLNLNDPHDELEYKVLLAHSEVANSEEDRLYNGFARYVLHSEEDAAVETNKRVNLKKRAYMKFSSMSADEMKDFLRVWNHTHPVRSGTTDSTKSSIIEAAIGTIIEENSQEFLDTLSDEGYRTRVFLKRCIENQIIKQSNTKYMLPGGDVLGYSLEQTVDFLKNPDNQEVVLTLKSKVEANK